MSNGVLPHPCNGVLFDKWEPYYFFAKIGEEYGEMSEAYLDVLINGNDGDEPDAGMDERWHHLMLECTDTIVAINGFMEAMGCNEHDRQLFVKEINASNGKRDGGKRFKKGE